MTVGTGTDLSVGELARASGVSAQLLRHYGRLGLLRPARRGSSRYRRYSAEDRERLELIRALRDLDVDLKTIGRMLRGTTDWRSVAELHLRTLSHQVRVAQRRTAVLRATLRGEQALDVGRLDRLQRLARLERSEKTRFVSDELSNRLSAAAPAGLRHAIETAARVELPDDPSPEQLDAWLELAELVSDAGFLAHYRAAEAPAATPSPGERRAMQRANDDVLAAIRQGIEPHDAEARSIVRRWARSNAKRMNVRGERACAAAMLKAIDSGRHDPERRFWELLAILKPELRGHPSYVIFPWMVRGLRAWLAE